MNFYFIKKHFSLLPGLALLLLWANPVAATNWYVDNAVASSGNGTSWATAWKQPSNIIWASIQPGDTVYFSGGTTGKTYHEILEIRHKSGTADNRITFTPGLESGHNGTVTFLNDSDADFGTGVFLHNSDYITIRGFTITTPENKAVQTDGIYMQYGSNTILENNTIIIENEDNTEPVAHDDCIQAFEQDSSIIRNNYCEQSNAKTFNAQGIWIENAGGDWEIYNNVVYSPNSYNGLIIFWGRAGSSSAASILHNTVMGGKWGNVELRRATSSVIKNNIIVGNGSTSSELLRILDGEPTLGNIDNNLYYGSDPNPISYLVSYTPLSWQTRGHDRNSLFGAAPDFIDVSARNFAVGATSPAVDLGASAGVSVDRTGVVRPQGTGHDIGAFEFQGSRVPTYPAGAVNVARDKPATASSLENGSFPASYAVDGNLTSRWSSQYSNVQWLQVDLGVQYTNLARAVLKWNPAYATAYEIQLSDNGTDWTTAYSTATGNGDYDDIPLSVQAGRYVRFYGTVRGSQWGYSLWELEVFGTSTVTDPADTEPPTTPTNLTPSAVSSSQINLAWTSSTDDVGVTGYDIYCGGSLLTSVAGTSYQDTGLTPATTYSYQVRAKDAAGNTSAVTSSVSATTQGTGGGGGCLNCDPSCASIFTASSTVPSGFGASWNQFTSTKELLLSVTCSGSNLSVSAGNSDTTTYVYNTGYRWASNAWQPYLLSGSTPSGNWFQKSATTTIPKLSGTTYFVGYTCQRISGAWKCGCRDATCSTSYWQLQGVE